MTEDAQTDGYYGDQDDDDISKEEIDLRFLDEEDSSDSDSSK